jgi:hypothetical protein
MLPRVFAPRKRHSSKERANLRRCAAMLTDAAEDWGRGIRLLAYHIGR